MEISKILLTVKENMVGLKQVGVNEFKSYTSKNDSSKLAALEAFMTLMNSIETNETISETVVHVFLPDIVYKPFVNGSVASYIRCNKTRKGSELSTDEVKAYDKAYDMYLARAKNLVLRTSDFKALDKAKETSVKTEIKECYLKLEKALKKVQAQPKIIVQQPAAPVMSESTKRIIDTLNEKAQEALLNGDIDLMERLLTQVSKLEANHVNNVQASSQPTTETASTAASTAIETVGSTTEVIKTTETTVADTEGDNELSFQIKVQKSDDNMPEGLAAFMNAQ